MDIKVYIYIREFFAHCPHHLFTKREMKVFKTRTDGRSNKLQRNTFF